MKPRFVQALLLVSVLAVAGCGGDNAPATIPDTVPPLTPVVDGVSGNGSVAYIWWEPNTEPDLAGYFVYVTVNDETHAVNATPTRYNYMYVDAEGTAVRLQVSAIDHSGNESSRSAAWRIDRNATPRPDRGDREPPALDY
jgi:hypothetical protein